jgi:hypothetical protein
MVRWQLNLCSLACAEIARRGSKVSLALLLLVSHPANAQQSPPSPPMMPVMAAPNPTIATDQAGPNTLPQIGAMVQVSHQMVLDGAGNLDESGFLLARSRIDLNGKFGQRLGFQFSAAADSGRPELFTAFFEYTPLRFLSVKVGQMRVPFSRSASTPEEYLTFPERSAATEEFAYFRDIGLSIRVHTPADHLEVILAAFNGSGPNRANDNQDPMLILRVAGVPVGQAWQPAEGDPQKIRRLGLALGGTLTMDYVPAPSAYGFLSGSAVPALPITTRDTDKDGRLDDVRVLQLAADIALRFRGIAFECELYQRRENWKQIPNQPGTVPLVVQNSFRAWFAQLSYFILPERLQVAARASVARVSPLTLGGRVRPETTCTFPDGTSSTCRLPYADVRSELAATVAYFYSGLRFSGTYSRYRWSSDSVPKPPAATENQITLQAQWAL